MELGLNYIHLIIFTGGILTYNPNYFLRGADIGKGNQCAEHKVVKMSHKFDPPKLES